MLVVCFWRMIDHRQDISFLNFLNKALEPRVGHQMVSMWGARVASSEKKNAEPVGRPCISGSDGKNVLGQRAGGDLL